jgi:hypothetical protein
MYGNRARAVTTKKIIESTLTTLAADAIVARKGEIEGLKCSVILTSLYPVMLIDATNDMMIGAVNGVTIVGIIITVGLETVEVTGGTPLREYLTCRLRSN